MARVKFNVNTEYAYLQNFKILQGERETAGGYPEYTHTAKMLLPQVASHDMALIDQ